MCEITIDHVIGINTQPGPSPDSIEVSGTISGCNKLAVTINDAGPIEVELDDGVGVWTAVFLTGTHYAPQMFVCRETDLKVHAECIDGSASCSVDADLLLECRPEGDHCPEVSLEILSVSDACAGDGTRSVELKATISSIPSDTVYKWIFGNGEEESNLLTTNEIVRTQSYVAGTGQTYSSQFSFILPQGCSGDEISIGPLDECPLQCPQGTIEVVAGPGSECIDGKRRVTLRFTVTAGDTFTAASIDFGDNGGESPTIVAAPGETISSDVVLDAPIAHDYQAPQSGDAALEYAAQVVFVPEVDGCGPVILEPPLSITACETECGDYRIADLEITVGGCVGGRRQVTAEVISTGPNDPDSYEWEWSDGHHEMTSGNSASHDFETSVVDTAASVAVVVIWPNDCTDIQTKPFVVAPCVIQYDCPELDDIVPEEGGCSDSGERSLTLIAQVSGSPAGEYTWDFGDTTTATSQAPVSPAHDYTPGSYTVGVSLASIGPCPEVSIEREIVVAGCPDVRRPPRLPPPPPWCGFLRLIGLVALIVGLVLIFGGACSGSIPIAIIGGIVAAAGFALLVAWALLCAGFAGGCLALQHLIEILALAEIVLFILSVVFGILAIFEIGIPCLIGAMIDTGIVGALLAVLNVIFAQLGCQISRPLLIESVFGRGATRG